MIRRSLAVNRSVAISLTAGGISPGALNMSNEMTASPTFMRVRMTEPRKFEETTAPVRAVSPLAPSAIDHASGRSASETLSPALALEPSGSRKVIC